MNLSARFFAGALLAGLIAAVFSPALALASSIEWHPYTREAFTRSQNAGKTVLISVHADW